VPILPIAAVLIAGALLRLANLSNSVAAVDPSWRVWSYHAPTEGPARMYGPKGHTVALDDIEVPVVYPPLALYELALIGRVHLARSDGRFPPDQGDQGCDRPARRGADGDHLRDREACGRPAPRVMGRRGVLAEPGGADDHDARLRRRGGGDPGRGPWERWWLRRTGGRGRPERSLPPQS